MAAKFVVPAASGALTASATKSLWLCDPVTSKVVIWQMDCSMDSATVLQGVRIDLYRETSLGTPAGSSVTPLLIDPGDDQTATSTWLTDLTTEPTTKVILASWYLQPCGGTFPTPQLPLGREIIVPAGATTARVGLQYTTQAGVTPNCVANVWFEE